MEKPGSNKIPVWLLDVDNVINVPPPYSYDSGNNVKKRYKNHPEWIKTVIHDFQIMYATAVVDFINDVSRQGLVKIKWTTSWGEYVVSEFAPGVGLDTFAVTDVKGSEFIYPHSKWWKYLGAKQAAEQGPFIWTDDDISKEAKLSVLAVGEKHGHDGVVIAPARSRGLEQPHLDEIMDFLVKHADNTA